MTQNSAATAVVTEPVVTPVVETPVVETPVVPAEAPKVEPTPSEVKPPEPQTLELKLPEGSLLSADHVEKVKAWAQENKLSSEEAQKILERDSSTYKTFHEGQAQLVKNTIEKWPEQLKADPEFGGAKYEETVTMAKRGLDAYGDAQLKEELNKTGLGNHPLILKAFARVGRAMADDSFIQGSTEVPAVRKSTADVLYANSTSKKN